MGIKVTIDLQTSRISVEGEEGDLLTIAKAVQDLIPKFDEVNIVRRQPGTVSSGLVAPLPVDTVVPTDGSLRPGAGALRDLGPRDFAKRLPVSTIFDRVTVLVYYACKVKGMPFCSVGEIAGWFGLCGWPKPAQMAVAVSDTSRRKETIDSKGRDKWTITTIGENFVIELIERSQGG